MRRMPFDEIREPVVLETRFENCCTYSELLASMTKVTAPSTFDMLASELCVGRIVSVAGAVEETNLVFADFAVASDLSLFMVWLVPFKSSMALAPSEYPEKSRRMFSSRTQWDSSL